MGMTEQYINEITLKYLLNPSKLEKDFKFYRKRINQLTKDMGKGGYPNNFMKSLYYNYAGQIIYYFKNLDEKDIIQQEYENLDENLDEKLDENLDEKFNNLIVNCKEKSSLNNFVKKINLNEDEKVIPQKKKLNIKDPKFKTKGV